MLPRRASSRRRPSDRDYRAILVQLTTAVGIALTALGAILVPLNDVSDALPIMALTPLGVVALVWLNSKIAEPNDREFLLKVLIAALLLRLGLGLVIHYVLPVWFFAPDQITYQDVGWRTLLYHRGVGPMPWQIQGTTEVGYFYWNAFLYMLFGYAPIAPKILNAFIGTGSVLLAYRLAGELAGREPARYAAVLTMFFPSLVLWSTQNLRDPIVLLVTLALFLSAVRLRLKPSGLNLFGVLLAISLLLLFRDYIAVMAVFGLVGSSVLSKGRGLFVNILLGALLFGLALAAYQQLGLGAKWVESASFEAIAQQREALAIGGSAFRSGADVSTPLRGLQFFPIGLAFFLFSPFPWQVGSTLTIMTLPEQLLWYSLVPLTLGGALYLIRTRFSAFSPVLVFMALTSSVYALVEGNAGTAYRHRAQVMVFFLVVAAVGIAVRQAKRRPPPRSAPLPATDQAVDGDPSSGDEPQDPSSGDEPRDPRPAG